MSPPTTPEPFSLPEDSPLLRVPRNEDALRSKVQTMRHQGIDDERIVQTFAFDGVEPEQTWAIIKADRAVLAQEHRRTTIRWGLFGVALCCGGYLLRVRFGASKGLGLFLALSAVGIVIGLLAYLTSIFRAGGR